MDTSDKDLVGRYLDGDVGALEQLVQSHRRVLYGYIVNMTGGNDADDVFQEVWLRAIRKLSRYKHQNLGGWLIRIAHNIVIDRARRRKPVLSLDQENESGGSLAQTIQSDGLDAVCQIANAELGRHIGEAVKTLPDDQREVFVMRVQSGLTFKEIAAVQRVSINTALARMQYALAKLRPLLQGDYEQLAEGQASA